MPARTAARPAARPAASPRTVHLIDVENLVGSAFLDEEAVSETARRYAAAAGLVPGDQVVVATSRFNARNTWFSWGMGARRLTRSGENGADLALLGVIETERLAERFGRVVIGSGDGIFAEAAARLLADGTAVTVISRPESISRRLRMAVGDVRLIESDAPAEVLAA